MINTGSDWYQADKTAEPGACNATETGATNNARPSRDALSTGACVGGLLNSVMTASLFAANRLLNLEPYAIERDAACFGLFLLCSIVPIIRFVRRPAQMFTAGLSGWMLFVAGYTIAGLYFKHLFSALQPPFEVLIEGGLVYGIAATTLWNVRTIVHARRGICEPDGLQDRLEGITSTESKLWLYCWRNR